MSHGCWKFCVDQGGTFTDCVAVPPADNPEIVVKVLSDGTLRGRVEQIHQKPGGVVLMKISHRWPPCEDVFTGYSVRLAGAGRAVAEVVSSDIRADEILVRVVGDVSKWKGREFELGAGEEAPVLAMRLATGTGLTDQLPPLQLRLGSTKGTNALLERRGARVALVVNRGFRDLLVIGTQQRNDLFELRVDRPDPWCETVIETPARLSCDGDVVAPLSDDEIARIVDEVKASGCSAVAIALLHSYRFPDHESRIASALASAGLFTTASSELSRSIKILPRAQVAVVNAYLSDAIASYVAAIRRATGNGRLLLMTSAGGLASVQHFAPKDALLSGPAGGMVGAAHVAAQCGFEEAVTFDMGGTSTDVSRVAGPIRPRHETVVAGARLLTPALDIETVAAGGGSVCRFDGHKLTVGPDSAGAFPGPACYGFGGPLTITDVNLLLGRADPKSFGVPVSVDRAETAFRSLVVSEGESPETRDDVLKGLLDIANERMADAVRRVSLSRGHDPSKHVLVAFGGAGGQHVCAIADHLGMRTAVVPRHAGVMSAVGMRVARIERRAELPVLEVHSAVEHRLLGMLDEVEADAIEQLREEAVGAERLEIQKSVLLRFEGQDHDVELPFEPSGTLLDRFRRTYHARYCHWVEDRSIEVVSVLVVARESEIEDPETPKSEVGPNYPTPARRMSGRAVFQWASLAPGDVINVPSVIASSTATVVVEEGWDCRCDGACNLILYRCHSKLAPTVLGRLKSVELELFANRFRSVAVEMGTLLERTSFSVNVKERLDFSCAVLDATGEMVVNAPHIPVHLGGMGLCVRTVVDHIDLGVGDIAITNHPAFGGSHLPDVTLVAPVHGPDAQLIGYVANRAHHAEIGGSRPGSMPPDASCLAEEGVVIPPTYLVRDGRTRWTDVRRYLLGGPYPTRAINENLADLQAAVASIELGRNRFRSLVDRYDMSTVSEYMEALKSYASHRVDEAIAAVGVGSFEAEEFLDDGTRLHVRFSNTDEGISFDFEGTAAQHPGNMNATPAIVTAVVLYVLRTLVRVDIPLNEGLLRRVRIGLPEGLLNPAFSIDPFRCPAVVGGNVETSQRLVDTLLKGFGIVACSQGTMNNLLFGNERFSYYETVAGGTGAGRGFHGTSGIHHHMTNTRITDPEVLEHRYPVRLNEFRLRHGSGGDGEWRGGDGVVRDITFLEPVSLTILSQHRVVPPYGMKGGQPGAPGRQHIEHADGLIEELFGVDGAELEVGSRVVLETPGGGGYGRAKEMRG